MVRVTLDAGPVIAYERGDADAVRLLKHAVRHDVELCMSAATVAEVWRGVARGARVARMLKAIDVVDVDRRIAQRAGTLLGATGTANAVVAIVVATAEGQRSAIITSDLADVRPLADVAGVDVRAF